MTSDQIESGKRFAGDLRRIRESRGLDRADVVAALRLAPDILESFDATGLVDHPMYNRVYLRSFVRSYSAAISTPPEAVSAALEDVFHGRYRGALGVSFLGDTEDTAPVEYPVADPGPGLGTGSEPGKAASSAAMSLDVVSPTASSGATRTAAPGRILPSAPLVGWFPLRRYFRSVLFSVGAGLMLVSAGWWIVSNRAPIAPVPEPLAFEEAPAPALLSRLVVGDTMRLYVVAVDTLNPVRITVDDRLRAPYWIEVGDSMGFDVTQRIILEREVDQMSLSYEGRRLPLVGTDTSGTLTLTRLQVQEILDSLRTAR